MDLFSVISLFGGLAFFLYGMHVMSQGLEKMAGGKLQTMLRKMTQNKLMALLLGAVITIAIQSSSALTVMLVGFVNSGIMQFGETIVVVMGSNIGTTLTAWMTSTTGISSNSVFLNLLKPANFAPIFALVGIIMIMAGKRQQRRDLGAIFVGFSVLMFGMTLMSDAVSPLAQQPEFTKLLTAFENPLLGVLVGALFTGVIQSSAASVGVLQALSLTGAIRYSMAIPLVMGLNIGTCVTALLSAIGVNRNAKRVAVMHISLKVLGTVICLLLFYGLHAVVRFSFVSEAINPVGVALVHSVFNILTTAIFLPFTKQIEKGVYLLVREPNTGVSETAEVDRLDERFVEHPALAVEQSRAAMTAMARKAKKNLSRAIQLLTDYSEDAFRKVQAREEVIDHYEDRIGTFLVALTAKDLSDAQNREVSKFLHTISDYERIGDRAVNLSEAAQEIHAKKIVFSDAGQHELDVITSAVAQIVELSESAFNDDNVALAYHVEPLEEVIDSLCAEAKLHHIARVKEGRCSLSQGYVFNDLITNFERIADHCSNIAVAVIALHADNMDTHEILNELKTAQSNHFGQYFSEYSQLYHF